MTQSVITKQLSFIFQQFVKKLELTLRVKGTGERYVYFFWVMSVLLSLDRGIKDARQAEEWEIKLKLG